MNNLKKIGLSALAGSLVAFSVNAGEMTVTGSAGMTLGQVDETAAAGFAQSDSLTFTGSGETDGGLNVSVSFEIDGDTSGFDDRSFSVGNDSIGTFSFHGSGGSSVMGGWDDLTPSAYEEVWTGTTGAAADVVNGVSGTNLIRYDSPSISGVTVAVAYQDAEQTTTASTYTDFGIQIKPEMVEGLTLGYAEGSYDTSATLSTDESTMYALYTMGAVSVGYQASEIDAGSSDTTDETVSMSISYAVSDDISISYGTHEVDFGDQATDQESSGFSASYTAGGMTIAGYMNSVDNVAGGTASTDDRESYELSLSFAF
ncbi:porin [Candidatus Pelagibacter ubique]|nr:porin [Candidatus Pelagibacter ubique]